MNKPEITESMQKRISDRFIAEIQDVSYEWDESKIKGKKNDELIEADIKDFRVVLFETEYSSNKAFSIRKTEIDEIQKLSSSIKKHTMTVSQYKEFEELPF